MKRKAKTFIPLLLCLVAPILIGCPEREHVRADYVGDWRNDDRETDGVTRIVITLEDLAGNDQLLIHPYGACVPDDCDWGTNWALWDQNGENFGGYEATTFFEFGHQRVDIWMTLNRQTRTLWVLVEHSFDSEGQDYWTFEPYHKYG